MTKTNEILNALKSALTFTPNQGQLKALSQLADFIHDECKQDFFILTGPAGSGKSSLVRSLVEYFDHNDTGYYLASPTGRSAQILARKTGSYAATLHHLLFRPELDEKSMKIQFIPKCNKPHEKPRFFIVDEASMISDRGNNEGMFFQNESLLGQLIKFVKQGNQRNKLILIGDRYQLPPVGCQESPALSTEYLTDKYHLTGKAYELSQVERQAQGSYILDCARQILNSIQNNRSYQLTRYSYTSSFSNSIQRYLSDFVAGDCDHAIMIAFANGQVNALNTWARKFRYNYKDKYEIMPEDLMISNHNVFLGDASLFKGSHFIVLKTWKPEEFAGLHFINTRIRFTDIDNETVTAETKILIESVTSQDGNLSVEQEKNLLHEAFKRNPRFRESKNPADDAFVNAVRARYGYALTCHKAQGGEWKNVYLHPGYRKNDLRWLYTAITRASENLFSWEDRNLMV